MKRLLLGCLAVFICPLSAVIVNGYKYIKNERVIYLLSDVHIEEHFADKRFFVSQFGLLKNIFISLLKKYKCGVFLKNNYTEGDVCLLSNIDDFFEKHGKLNTLNFRNQKLIAQQLKKECINTYALLEWSHEFNEAQKSPKNQGKTNEELFELLNNGKDNIFNYSAFCEELKKIKPASLPSTPRNTSEQNLQEFKSRIFDSNYMNRLAKSFFEYRDTQNKNFIQQLIKDNNKIIIVIGSPLFTESIKDSFDGYLLTEEVGQEVDMQVLGQDESFIAKYNEKKLTIKDFSILEQPQLNKLFGFSEPPLTTFQWLKQKAWEWKKALIPATAAAVGLGYWWLKNRSTSPVIPKVTGPVAEKF